MPGPDRSIEVALDEATETRGLEIGSGILSRTPELFRRFFGSTPALVVADRRTFAAAGQAVENFFDTARHPRAPVFVYSGQFLSATEEHVSELEKVLRNTKAQPVAVGSGTINDLTKLAAHRVGRPYMVVATAASMDGYTASGASILSNGLKQTFPCPAARVVIADLAIIRRAPGLMNVWGYADMLAKITAGADWILADALSVEPINRRAWAMAQSGLRRLLGDGPAIRQADPEALENLVRGLMLGGFAMQIAQSSRPASGAEHQFSHLWDMERIAGKTVAAGPSHGFKVAIGTLAVTALYEQMLREPLDQLDIDACLEAWPGAGHWREWTRRLHADSLLAAGAMQEMEAKRCAPAALRRQLCLLKKIWPHLRQKLRNQLVPRSELTKIFRAAGIPTEPEELGMDRSALRRSYVRAYTIRRRFTVLDLAVRTGLLEPSLEEIFA